MKAIYYPTHFAIGAQLIITDGPAHHLLNVVRLQSSEALLLQDGQGQKAWASVVAIQKRAITVEIRQVEKIARQLAPEVLIFPPQKEYFGQMLRTACELGTGKIWVCPSNYTAKLITATDHERWQKILISALEQSQGAYLPELSFLSSWEHLPHGDFARIWIFSSERTALAAPDFHWPPESRTLIAIGPEGGFSLQDYATFSNVPQVQLVHLPCPILRAVSALPVAWGFLLGHLRPDKKT